MKRRVEGCCAYVLLAWVTTWIATPLVVYGQSAAPVELHWLDGAAPAVPVGVSWGVPWPRGAVKKEQRFTLSTSDGKPLPVQTWPLAYWPDGSMKWTGFATVAGPDSGAALRIAPSDDVAAASSTLKATDAAQSITIETGRLRCLVPKQGQYLIESMSVDGREIARQGELLCILQQGPDGAAEASPPRTRYQSIVQKVTLEQSGPVRAVIKIEGVHQAAGGSRQWLPFVVRLYFFAGGDSVRVVHTFIFDGDQEKDFIRGLGVQFKVPMREQLHNRHVRFAGEETGVFGEPLRLISSREPTDPQLYARHIAGQAVPNLENLPNRNVVQQLAVWDAFKLVQISADSYAIQKRTNPNSAWINVSSGKRSLGMAFVGDTTGGLGIAMKNFWQLAPSALEVQKASTDSAEFMLWLWSPESPAMDLRHYDTIAHGLQGAYEDVEPGFSTATGTARTSEITLHAFTSVPDHAAVLKLAQATASTPRLVATPQYYHSIGTFGIWSLPNRSTPVRTQLEDQLDRMFSFYHGEVEQRKWYGFWDFGDVMHTYDPQRHIWKYDTGGFAWMNTEECPDVWLWYTFLRSGRADVFRMAEAMTRHTNEVDVYHLGRFAGLGSRHNVRHWGDGAKEMRVSQALPKRFYYYLTTDERTGDLMHEVVDADFALVGVDPLRKILPKTEYPTHIRTGPDWLAAVGNWMTEWERTGETKYRDKIIVGMKSLAGMPRGLLTGLSFGYDPKTGILYDVPQKQPTAQFVMIMGGAEVAFEVNTLLDVPEWKKAWMELCETWSRGGGDMAGPRAAGYVAHINKDAEAGRRAWNLMSRRGDGTGWERFPAEMTRVPGADVPNAISEVPSYVATGHLSQWALNIIETLELAGQWLPQSTAPQP